MLSREGSRVPRSVLIWVEMMLEDSPLDSRTSTNTESLDTWCRQFLTHDVLPKAAAVRGSRFFYRRGTGARLTTPCVAELENQRRNTIGIWDFSIHERKGHQLPLSR